MENLFHAVDVLMLGLATAFVVGVGIIYLGQVMKNVVEEDK